MPANTLKAPFTIGLAHVFPGQQVPIEEMVECRHIYAMLRKIEQALGFAKGNQIVDAI